MGNEIQNDLRSERGPEYFQSLAIQVIERLGSVDLKPADNHDAFPLSGLKPKLDRVKQALMRDEVSNVTLPLDQYLTATLTLDELFDKPSKDNLLSMTQARSMSTIELIATLDIINRAHQAMALRSGINVGSYPVLEYPIGQNTMPDLLHINLGSRDCATIFVHRNMVTKKTRDTMVNGFNTDNTVSDNNQTNARMSTQELTREVKEWAKYLETGWNKVDEDTWVETSRDEHGLTNKTNVKGWACLEIDPEFVKLARTKLFFDLTNLLKDKKMNRHQILSKYRQIDGYVPEYVLLGIIFYNELDIILNKGGKSSGSKTVSKEQMRDILHDPTIVTLDDKKNNIIIISGIVTDIPEQDVLEKCMLNADDELLTSTDTGPVTLRGKHHIYVHPKIWVTIQDLIGSKLKLN